MLKAWPICRLPVTFGGGIMMVKGFAFDWTLLAKAPLCSHSG
jgi:hypothetical protein